MLTVTATDEIGRAQAFTLDAAGKLTVRTKYKGATPLATKYRRDALGRIDRVTDPAGNQWSYRYDLGGRRDRVEDPDLGVWTYGYDQASRLSWQRDARNVTTTLGPYDGLSRLTRKCISGGGVATEITQNSYDQQDPSYSNLGHLTNAWRAVTSVGGGCGATPAVKIERQYDYELSGRLQREQHLCIGPACATKTLAYDYWPNGALRRKKLADGTWSGDHSYDPAGRLTGLANSAGETPASLISSIRYNARGQTEKITYGNGVVSDFDYNADRGWLNSVKTAKAGINHLDQTYVRNARGMITAITSPDAASAWTYAYDDLGRLISADRGRARVRTGSSPMTMPIT